MPRDLLKDGVSAAQDNEDFIWEPQEATEEEVRQLMQQAMKEANDEYLATIVYDAGSGKRMSLRQFEKKYGTDEFSKELVHAAKNRAQYSKETAGKIKSLHAKLLRPDKPLAPKPRTKAESKPEPQKNPEKVARDQFIPVPYRFVDKVKDAGCHHNPTALLMILLKHRTWKGKMDKHHTYTYWYKQKKRIVASRCINSLAEELGTSDRTVRKYLRQLEDNGDIETVKGEKFGSKRENVYILGEIKDDGTEVLYHTGQK